MEDDDIDVSPPTSTMSQSRKFETSSLNIRLFEPSALDSKGLVDALANLKHVLHSCPFAAVETLLSRPSLFEYIYSVLEESDARVIDIFLVDSFPSTCEGFQDSLHSKVLHRIAEYIFLLPDDADDVEKPEHSSRRFSKIKAGIRALGILNASSFSVTDDVSEDEDEDEEIYTTNARRKMYRRQRRHRESRRSISIDASVFKVFDEDVPSCQEDVVSLSKKLLNELWLLIQTCLSDLRSPSLANLIRHQYIRAVGVVGIQVARNINSTKPLDTVASAAAESQTSVFPIVQPLKASLYFDSVKGFGDWRIYISTRAEKHLREHKKNLPTFKIIVKKIKELSRGHFSFDNQKRLSGPDKGIPIFEAKLSADLRLVYQVDCISDYGSDAERQAIRVYGIFTHAQMNKHLWDYLSTHLDSKGAEYRRRVIYRSKPKVTGDNVYLPESWPPERKEADSESTTISIGTDANGLQDIHQWMVLEKYVALSQTLLTCILAEQEVSPVFNVSPFEREIIEHDSSCYVLGRSGTGKTTTMMFKIFGIERAAKAQLHQNMLPRAPRQLFVTQSRVLAGRVEDYYKKLSDFLQTAYMSKDELVKRHRSKKVDEDVEELVDLDEEEWHDDLPKRFSELEDKHFPLFLTFDKLCKMLEAEFDLSFARQRYTKEHKRAQKRFKLSSVFVNDDLADDNEAEEGGGSVPDTMLSPLETAIADHEVTASLITYDVFRRDYWPHLPQNLTKNLDPALVFSEFMGVIKGSEQSLSAQKGYLSRELYLELSHRTQSTFSMSRKEIYDLFEAYQRRMHSQGDYDSADRTHAIIQKMRESGRTLQGVDFLYVDEAQDNLLADAHLLRLLCTNSHGLFWAGDTAQTIAIGSSFRFNDLKSFLHRIEEHVETNPVKPSSFQLTMNYRSHGGIVSCADSVIQLITRFWPYSIDILQREKGAVEGTKPVFFIGWEEDTLRYEQFLFGDSGNAVEFGAQQCILVRDDNARDLLRKQVGEIGLILTLYESKGLEFDDVLLYNFFQDSSCDASQWRVVLNALDPEVLHGLSVPQFNELRHVGICTELKFLYVAMTRARKNLWIVDKSDKGAAMRTFFKSRNLVELCTPDQTPALAVSSSPDEWDKMGRSLFTNKQYHQAMHCFERADLLVHKAIAHAYYLRQQARALDKNTSKRLVQRKLAFTSAADAFVECAQDSDLSARANESYWRNAGECFVEADNPRRAAEAYFEAELYTDAVKQFKKACLYDEAVRVVQDKRKFIEEAVADNVMNVSRLHYLRMQKPEKVVTLFDTIDEGLEFIEDFGSNASRADILEKLGRYTDAAEIHVAEGLIGDAVRLFLLANNAHASNRAAVSVLNRLWDVLSFGATLGRREEATSLLGLCANLDGSHLSAVIVDQLSMFDAINNSNPSSLVSLCDRFRTRHNHLAATIFCLDQLMQRLQKSDVDSPERSTRTLSLFLLFAELTRTHIWNGKDCLKNETIQKLLGVHQNTERRHEFVLLENSMLSKFRLHSRRFDTSPEVEQVMHQDSLAQLIRDAIPSYMGKIAMAVTRVCERSRAFITPCLNHAALGSCFSVDCEREHVNPLKIRADWFVDRLNIHLQMVACLQAVDFALESIDRETLHRKWLERISQLMFPAKHTLGNAGIVASSCTPEQLRALNTVQAWVHEGALLLQPDKAFKHFLDAVAQMLNFSFWFDKPLTDGFIWRSPFLSDEKYRTTRNLSEGTFYSPPNLVSAIGLKGEGSIGHGVNFLWFMLEPRRRFPINVFHLTELVEHLCGSVALLAKLHSGLHGLMLPRSWMLLLFRKIDFGVSYMFHYQRDILNVTERLISILVKPDSANDFPHLGSMPNATRIICVNRLCRSVVLMGYNIHDYEFQYHVVRMLRRMKSLQKYIPQMNKEYFEARTIDWKHLSTAVRRSVLGSYLDEMVQLQKAGNRPLARFEEVRQVTIQGPNDVLAALNQGQRTTVLSATAAPFIPQSIQDAEFSSTASDATDEPTSTSSQEDPQMEGTEQDEDANDGELATETEAARTSNHEMSKEDMAPVVTLEATAAELSSVALIKAKYALYKSKRQRATKESAQSKRIRQHFLTCLQSVGDACWPSRYRRMVFLGIVPLILACLDQISERAAAARSKIQKQLDRPSDQTVDYDSYFERIGKFTNIQRSSIKLKKQLNPPTLSAALRSDGAFDFKKIVIELQVLADALGDIGSAGGDLKLVKKAILQADKYSMPKPPKPTLNVEDVIDVYM